MAQSAGRVLHQAGRHCRGDLARGASRPQRVVLQCRDPPLRRDLVTGDSAGGLHDAAPHLLVPPEPADLEGDDRRAALRRRDRAARQLAEGIAGLALGFRRSAPVGGGPGSRDGIGAGRPHRLQGGPLVQDRRIPRAQPFGTVPAAFSPDGRTGIFESNSIMRAVARLGHDRFPLYGRDPYEASRIDGFLDASLVFARDAQIYLFALGDGDVTREIHARAKEAFTTYLAGIEQTLRPDGLFLVGDTVTLADICFVA